MIMKSMLAPMLLAAVPAAGLGLQLTSSDATLQSLRGLESSTTLSGLRAGAPVAHTLGGEVRDELRQADQKSGSLADLRAGAFSDREWMIVGFTALAILLLIVIF